MADVQGLEQATLWRPRGGRWRDLKARRVRAGPQVIVYTKV